MLDTVDLSRKRVLVLGASGYIGAKLVDLLSRSPIYHPVAASRRSAVAVDATDPDSLQNAMHDIDCVIDCISGSDKVMMRCTEVLCKVARLCPPRRIIFLSSMAVYGAATGTVAEDHATIAPVSSYGQTKIDCERIVRKYVDDGGDAVILRPTCVFGPGSPQWTVRLARLLKARRIGDLGSAGDGCCNLAFIDDVVAAIVAAIDKPGISRRTFNVSSSAELTWNEFLVAFAKALGSVPVRRIPPRILRLETKLLAPIRRIAAIAVRSPATEAITPSLAALWRQDIHIDCSAAQAALALSQTSPDRMITASLARGAGLNELAVT